LKNILVTLLKVILPAGIGIYLTWFFISRLTTLELDNLKEAFLNANYLYIIFAIIIMLLSHMSRAYRWKYMLSPLGHQPSFWKMYHSIMIGYVINLTIPRSGELARAGYYAKFQKGVGVEKVFGTIIVERIIDLVMLGLVFMITAYLQKDLEALNSIKESAGGGLPPWIFYAAGAIVISVTAVFFMSTFIRTKVIKLLTGILEGVKTILQLKQRLAYIGHTLFIWICYVGMIWICSFALPETSGLEIAAVFAAFIVGAAAITATPGGIGLYPLLVATVLTDLYGIENAGSFSLLAWSSLTLFTIVFGLLSLILLPIISKKA
jgi:uncharacterized protein (TIRG00374 family)